MAGDEAGEGVAALAPVCAPVPPLRADPARESRGEKAAARIS